MDSSVAPLPHRRSHLPTRSFRSMLHHLCSSFERDNQISLATPAVLKELVIRTEIAQVPSGGTCEAGEVLPESSLILEPRSDGVSGESRTENVETISLENNLMLGDVFDGIDLQDASVRSQHKDFFDEFELIINEDFAPETCVNICEALDVSDYGDDGMAKQAIDLVPEKPSIADEVQVDCDEKNVSEIITSKAEQVPKLVEVVPSGVLKTNDEDMEPVTSSQVLTDSILQMVDDDEVEEGEISGDENDNMLVEDDDFPVERHEESHVSQEVLDKRRQGTSKSTCSAFEVLNGESGIKEIDQTSNNQEKMDSQTSIKKRSVPSKDAKARKKEKARKKRARERIALGVKKLKLKPVAPKPKPIRYCRHYLKGRCFEGELCKFSHDTTPETKSSPCCYFATQSCMKGEDCPYDHDLSKYPCNNFMTKGSCHRGDKCLFSHKGTPQAASDTPSANVTTSLSNIAAASFSPQKSNKQTVRQAIARLPAIQARVSSSAAFLKPSSQCNLKNSSDASSSKTDEDATVPQVPPLRKPSVAPKGMSFLSLDKTTQEKDTVKPSLGSKQNILNSDDQSLKQSEQISSVPVVPPKGISFLSSALEEPSSSRNLKIAPNLHIQSSLHSAMKLAAEFESTKAERRTNGNEEAVNKGDVTVNTSVTRNSGNISSKILDFLSSFSHGKS